MLNIKKIKPLNNQVIVTSNRYEEAQTIGSTSILDSHRLAGSLKEYQTVIAVGNLVRNIEVGDTVVINPRRYAKMKHSEGSLKDGVITDNPVIGYNIPTIELDGVSYLKIYDTDIDFVILDYEEIDDLTQDEKSKLIIPKQEIIV
jgi:co-chaperonin GroES (HSP10)